MAGRPLEFPNPDNFGKKDAIIFCDRERALGLYNQAHDNKLEDNKNTNIAKELKNWFVGAAMSHGWIAHPVKHPTRKHAGFLLFNFQHSRTGNQKITLPFYPIQDDSILEAESSGSDN